MTLHVGLDTFRPLEGDFLDEHRIHRSGTRSRRDRTPTIAAAPGAGGGRVVAVGTTTVRVLETCGAGGRCARLERTFTSPRRSIARWTR